MNKFKLITCLFFMTFISCDDKSIENHYENDKIEITFKENKAIFSEKSISLQFGSKDTIIESKNYTFKDIKGLLNSSLNKNYEDLKYTNSTTFDITVVKKDSLLNEEEFYNEFKKFLLEENLIEVN